MAHHPNAVSVQQTSLQTPGTTARGSAAATEQNASPATRKIQRGHRIRLDPTPEQIEFLLANARLHRVAWNTCLAEFRRRRSELRERKKAGDEPTKEEWRKSLGHVSLSKHWTDNREQALHWADPCMLISSVGYRAIDTLSDAIRASGGFRRDFSQRKTRLGEPQFKSRNEDPAFRANNSRGGVRIDGKHLHLQKSGNRKGDAGIGPIRMRERLRLDGQFVGCVISRRADHWYASVTMETVETVPQRPDRPIVGVDLGIKSLAATSEGELYQNPRALREHLKELRRLQRHMSRQRGPYCHKKKEKQKPSNGWLRNKKKLAKLHERIANLRLDAHHKVAKEIVDSAGVLGMEDLHVRGMLKNRKLAKSVSDASLAGLARKIAYKADWSGVEYVEVDRWYPSSKTCSHCGYKNSDLKLSQRAWVCPQCGARLDRDLNAAENLRQKAAAGQSVARGSHAAS